MHFSTVHFFCLSCQFFRFVFRLLLNVFILVDVVLSWDNYLWCLTYHLTVYGKMEYLKLKNISINMKSYQHTRACEHTYMCVYIPAWKKGTPSHIEELWNNETLCGCHICSREIQLTTRQKVDSYCYKVTATPTAIK